MNQPMRVVWLSHRDIEHPSAGGAERSVHEISRRLSAGGDQVTVVTAGWKGAPTRARVEGVEIRRFPGLLAPHLALPLALNLRPRPDIAIDDLAHVVPWGTPLWGNVPTTVVFRHLHARTLPGQVSRLGAWALIGIERTYPLVYPHQTFVTESRQSAADLVRLGISESRCRVIRPGVDTDLFRPGPRTARPSLIYFGGMRAYKRPADALYTLRAVRAAIPEVELEMIGNGPELGRLKALARDLDVTDHVQFVGRLDAGQLARAVPRAWVNLHCSRAEGWGYSPLEAASAGVPTVAYRVPGIDESVDDGGSGILVPDGDRSEMARAVVEICGAIDDWGDRARQHALGFSWDATARAWTSHLHGVVAGGRTGPAQGRAPHRD